MKYFSNKVLDKKIKEEGGGGGDYTAGEGIDISENEISIDSETLDDIADGAEARSYFDSSGILSTSRDPFWQIGGTSGLVELKSAYSYVGAKKGIKFDGNQQSDATADLEKVLLPGGGYALHSTLPFYSDDFISAGGLSPGGGQTGGNASLSNITSLTHGKQGKIYVTGSSPEQSIIVYDTDYIDNALLSAGSVKKVAGQSPDSSGNVTAASLANALGTGAIISGDTDLVTGGTVYSYINEYLSTPVKVRGETTTELYDGDTNPNITIDGDPYTATAGDLVFHDGLEFIWTGTSWQKLGDETSYVQKSGVQSKGSTTLPVYFDSNAVAQTITGLTVSGDIKTTAGGFSLGGQYGSGSSAVESKLVWDSQYNAWHLIGNFYADGFISAQGVSPGGGASGTTLQAVWDSLTGNSGTYANTKINVYHIPIGSGLGIDGSGNIYVTSQGSVTGIKIGSTTYTPTGGTVDITSGIPTVPTNISAFTNDAGYLTGNETITLSGDVTGSGATSIIVSIGEGKVTNNMLAGNIANSKLANSSITIGSTSISLGGTASALAGLSKVTSSVFSAGGTLSDGTTESTISYDATNHAWKITGNIYATGFVSAGGLSDAGGGSGIDLDGMWQSLKTTIDSHATDKIAAGHIPDLSGTYQTKYGFTIQGTSGATYNLANFLTSAVTSIAGQTGAFSRGTAITIASNVISMSGASQGSISFDPTSHTGVDASNLVEWGTTSHAYAAKLTVGVGGTSPISKDLILATGYDALSTRITTLEGAADGEDITLNSSNKYRLADRGTQYGKGYVILRRDKTFAQQVTQSNTIYEIRYDFTLSSSINSITISSGTSASFDGVTYYYTSVSVPSGKTIKILNPNILLLTSAGAPLGKSSASEGTAYIGSTTTGTFTNAYALQDNINIPAGCVLRFNGGVIHGGSLVGDNTVIDAQLTQIFDTDMSLQGFDVAECYPEWFGAVGNDLTDDTNAVQQCVEYFQSTRLSAMYKVSRTIIFPQYFYRNIYGSHSGAIGTGSNYGGIGLHSSADIGIFIPYNSQRFYNFHLHDFTLRGEAGKAFGIKALYASNAVFSNLNIYGYTDGQGIRISGPGGVWGGQYCIIEDCAFNLCMVGASINQHGVIIRGCFFDGNDNNTEYRGTGEYGFKPASKAIYLFGGDSALIEGNRIQGWHYGIHVSNATLAKIALNRFESVAMGIYISSGQRNIVNGNNIFNNYILTQINGGSRYGAAAYVLGSYNIVENCIFQSQFGLQVNAGNDDRTGQVLHIDMGDVDIPQNGEVRIKPYINDFCDVYGGVLDYLRIYATNLENFGSNSSNFMVTMPEFYKATNGGMNLVNNSWVLALLNGETKIYWQNRSSIYIALSTAQSLATIKNLHLLLKLKTYVSEVVTQNILGIS